MTGTEVPGYELGEELGRGACGRVWSARRRRDGLRCAVKVVAPLDGDLDQAVREAAVLERVRHEHVLRLYDVLPLPGADGATDRLALVLELADGGSLAQVVGSRGHLTAGEVVTVLAPLARALGDLHAAGLSHGDLAPGNVLFGLDGKPRLSDLGVCRVAGEPGTDVFGADGFVAPEVLDGRLPSPASDVYGIGAVGWYCLAGAPAESAIIREPLETLAPHAPTELVDLVTACLTPDPESRPGARALSAALFEVTDPEPVALARGDDPALGLTHRIRAEANRPARSTGGGRTRGRGRGTHRARARSARLALVAAVAVVAVGLLGLALLAPGASPVRWWPGDVHAQGRFEPPARTQSAQAAQTGQSARVPDHDPTSAATPLLRSSEAASSQPRRLLQVLVAARARAWKSGNLDDLASAHAPGSAAMRRDRADLELAAEQQVGYADLEFTVREAEPVRVTDEGARLEAVVDRSAYRVVGPDPGRRPAQRGERVVVELRWTAQGWRIEQWS